MNPWWLGLLAAQATVACGDDTHRLRWEHGALQALDHDDPEAELALSALGGERCACAASGSEGPRLASTRTRGSLS